MNSWVLGNLPPLWFMPPGILLIIAAWGLARLNRHPHSGRALIAASLAALWLLAMPWCSRALLGWLAGNAADPLNAAPAQAIVVLGGGKYHAAPEYGGDTAGDMTLVRLRYAAALYRRTGKPILVSGGSPEGAAVSEAQVMKAALESEWRVPVQWAESASRTTLENARRTRAVLAPLDVNRVYLVTHAWHMPRARYAFEHAGFEVVPAPTRFPTHFRLTLLDFMPQAYALRDSGFFFHEVMGNLWYRLKSIIPT